MFRASQSHLRLSHHPSLFVPNEQQFGPNCNSAEHLFDTPPDVALLPLWRPTADPDPEHPVRPAGEFSSL